MGDNSKDRRVRQNSRFLPLGLLSGGSGLLAAIISNWKVILFGGLVAVITYQNTMTWEVLRPFGLRTIPGIIQDSAETIQIKQEQLDQCELGREKLKGEIEATNAQIDKWANLSQQLQNNQSKLSEELLKLKQKSDQEVQQILEQPVPPSCNEAMDLLRNAAIRGGTK